MTDEFALKISRIIRDALEAENIHYRGGSYGNNSGATDAPLLFRHNYTADGEKFNIELAFNDFDLGPFAP